MVVFVIGIVAFFHISDKFRRMLDYHVELKNEVDKMKEEIKELKEKLNMQI